VSCGAEKNRLRQPIHEPGKSLHQIVVNDHDGEQHKENECGLIDALFDAQADVAPHEAFDEEEQDDAAIENGDGQQVKDAEVEADAGGELQERNPAFLLGRPARVLRNADGAGHGAEGHFPLHNFLGQFKNEQRILFIFPQRKA